MSIDYEKLVDDGTGNEFSENDELDFLDADFDLPAATTPSVRLKTPGRYLARVKDIPGESPKISKGSQGAINLEMTLEVADPDSPANGQTIKFFINLRPNPSATEDEFKAKCAGMARMLRHRLELMTGKSLTENFNARTVRELVGYHDPAHHQLKSVFGIDVNWKREYLEVVDIFKAEDR